MASTAIGARAAIAGPHVRRVISSGSVPAGGFTPGTIVLGRYRIIGLLGRGGMGEVYRADDLRLGQPIALKFLPAALADDPVRRERFFAEVRITRQVSHPNICRVYDIAELDERTADGKHSRRYFLTMEYIDGEDLASLIARIGYLSNEKALDLTRQLVAGLAAAHERGVLHRDLKPANIMIDGRGRVRITDFGLAVAAGDDAAATEFAGTPAYMAPEQLAGQGATLRSDIYSLGLILYELYTGMRAFNAPTLADLRAAKEQSVPTAPSELRSGVDPVVERVIMRCVERDPRLRLSSVAQVAASLPGGDPLAAALAAGETPSPELVAASGGREGLQPRTAVLLLTLAVAGLIAAIALNKGTIIGRASLPESPEALAVRARGLLSDVGYTARPLDRAYGFTAGPRGRLRNSPETPKDLERVSFWYRESAGYMYRIGFETLGPPWHGVTRTDPPLETPGDVLLRLDGDGHLLELIAVPSDTSAPANLSVTWDTLFKYAGLKRAEWMETIPQAVPPFYADMRAEWIGTVSSVRGVPVRVEAAAYHGRAVWFVVAFPWTPAARASPPLLSREANLAGAITSLFLCAAFAVAAFFAFRNIRSGRGDRLGAYRLAAFSGSVWVIGWLLAEDHVPTTDELYLVLMFASYTLLIPVMTIWLLYIAFEPFVRRRWPHVMVSWTRLLAGEWSDPLVGRDVLVGCVAATWSAVLSALPTWLGGEPFTGGELTALGHTAKSLAFLVDTPSVALYLSLEVLFFLFVSRVVLRSEWAAATAAVIISSVITSVPLLLTAGGASLAPGLIVTVLKAVITVMLAMRVGLCALVAFSIVGSAFDRLPITFDVSAWYAPEGYLALAAIVALTMYGFRTSLGDRRLFEWADV